MRMGRRHMRGPALLLLVVTLVGAPVPAANLLSFPRDAHAAPSTLPAVADLPTAIVAGRDGALWFTETGGNRIGRITTAGAVREFTIPTSRSGPEGIAVGPDGAIWFTEAYADALGRLDPATGHMTEYPVPDLYGVPGALAVGGDGALYFTQNVYGSIGRFTPSTGRFAQFGLSAGVTNDLVRGPDGAIWFAQGNVVPLTIGRLAPDGGITFYSDQADFGDADVRALTAGPDGALWFTPDGISALGRLTTSGVFSKVPIPGGPAFALAAGPGRALWWSSASDAVGRLGTQGAAKGRTTLFPLGDGLFLLPADGLAAGPDGNLWCTVAELDAVVRLTPSGDQSQFAIPSAPPRPFGLATAPDGSAWATLPERNHVVHVTVGGRVHTFIPPTRDSEPAGIAIAPDGSAWFDEYRARRLAHLTAGGVVKEYPLPPGMGNPFTVAVAPNGVVWWAAYRFERLESLDPTSGKVTDYAGTAGIDAGSIVAGADGRIWLSDQPFGAIDRFDPRTGHLDVFRIPQSAARPYAIVAAPGGGAVFLLDGQRRFGEISAAGRITLRSVPGNSPLSSLAATGAAAYFTDADHDAIGRVGAGDAVSYLPVPTANTDPTSVVAAPDGAVWFIEYNVGQLARIDPASGTIREYPLAAAP